MKDIRSTLWAAVVGLVCIAQGVSAAPILEYKFNETGSSVSSSGTDSTAVTMRNSGGTATDLHSAAGTGVSGDLGDRAFDNTASTGMGYPYSGGYANQSDNGAIDSLTSFTLQGWFKTAAVPPVAAGARLISKGNSAFDLYIGSGSAGAMKLGINGSYPIDSAAAYTDVNTWVFFAATYDGSYMRFYKGTSNTVVSLVSTITASFGTPANNTFGLTIGNHPDLPAQQRPFDGLLDNIRIYGATSGTSGALSLADLESIRRMDIIPEPTSLTFLLLGGSLLFARRSRAK